MKNVAKEYFKLACNGPKGVDFFWSGPDEAFVVSEGDDTPPRRQRASRSSRQLSSRGGLQRVIPIFGDDQFFSL